MTGDQVVRLVPGDLVLRLVEVILGGLEEHAAGGQEEKSSIQETKNLSTDADSSPDTKKIMRVRQNSPWSSFDLCI